MNALPERSLRPLRLLQVLEPSGGGSGRHFIDLCRGLGARGHHVEAIYSPLRAEPRFIEELQSLGLPGVHSLAMRRAPGPSDLAAWRGLARIIRSHGPFDVVHGHSSKAGALCRLRLPGDRAARVYTPHAFRTMDPCLGSAGRLVYSTLETILARFFTGRVICVSADEYEHARRLAIPSRKLDLIVNGVKTPPRGARAAIRSDIGMGERDLLFGFVGRLCPQKAPERLLDAFGLVADRLPAARLLMIGSGEMEAEVRERIARSRHAGRIHLTSALSGPQAMEAIDVLVMPSRYEAMSYVMLEAAAAGKPMILTRVGGASTVLADGVNGLIVENDDDPRPLAEAMIAVADPARLQRYTGAARARSGGYGVGRMIGQTEALYRALTS